MSCGCWGGGTTKRSFLHYLISTLLPMDKIIFLGLDHMMFLDSLIICRFNLIVEFVSESEPNPNNNLTIRRAGLSIRLCHPSFLDQHLSDEKMLPWDKHEFCLKFYFQYFLVWTTLRLNYRLLQTREVLLISSKLW